MQQIRWSRARRTLIISVVALAVGSVAAGAPASGADDQGAVRLIEALVGDLMQVTALPGFSVAIVRGDGQIWARGFGYADVESRRPVTPATQFRAASVSKTMTVTALARLVQKDRLDLDAPLGSFDIDFPDPTGGITARRLAGHLAGIGHYQASDKIDRGVHYQSVADSLATFRDGERAGPPGDQYKYSTHGYTLLSAMIERAGEAPFIETLKTQVWGPLGMTSSGPDLRAEQSAQMSTLYNLVARVVYPIPKPEDPSYKWAGGGLISTPTDLVRMARSYWSGFLPEALVEEMFTSQKTSAGEMTGVGIGWRIGGDFAGRPVIHHAGSMGGARSVVLMHPEEKIAIAAMTNSTWSSSVERTAEILLEAFVAGDQGAAAGSSGREARYQYAGTFGGTPVNGELVLNGRAGRLSMPPPFKEWVRRAAVDQLPVRHLHDELWALITPYGLVALQLKGGDGMLSGEADVSRSRAFRFEARLEQ